MPSRLTPDSQPTLSTELIMPTRWASGGFQLSAGCCMIQPSSGNVVVVYDTKRRTWFLPRGRKDVGETLEQAAFREGYEESGFRPEPLPLLLPHRQPESPEHKQARKTDANPASVRHQLSTTEPVYITTIPVPPTGHRLGYEYTTFWYAAGLGVDAQRDEDTGMADEKTYIGKLISFEEALKVLGEPENYVVYFAYNQWLKTKELLENEDSPEGS
ncbi:hypothetical protein FRC14_006383 [Serendipita sp. 396]|nr:hypothetical protein FRC14_006383 [Serendipita sp. 396]KAG8779210.1 hypothetical protein FRC15_010311 [Serendipita sp. 397]KAG8828700.1 hypothetical protein FRC19_000088 [Serendipita sp. 401]KAG9058849.1 hypothetical protein FS842_000046 [Serendipita sp. 407]